MQIDITVTDNTAPPSPPDPIVCALALTGLAASQQGSLLSNLAYSNQVTSNNLAAKTQLAHQDASNRLRQSILANAVRSVQSANPSAARSGVTVLSSNAAAQSIADLRAAVASAQAPTAVAVQA
ncbi:hypothetical protein ACFQS6_01705 [Xanthomonas populi]|uniref:R body protein n=1 Tax=Xanthomonas populi TaxID=53414 RepID=A0A2S7EV80_9XANT|nr:hypothetical protein [Xanthomonas populi]PPU97045.1 hypothetical protein XpopCFBP1817_05600 [Xanthomonas populi]